MKKMIGVYPEKILVRPQLPVYLAVNGIAAAERNVTFHTPLKHPGYTTAAVAAAGHCVMTSLH